MQILCRSLRTGEFDEALLVVGFCDQEELLLARVGDWRGECELSTCREAESVAGLGDWVGDRVVATCRDARLLARLGDWLGERVVATCRDARLLARLGDWEGDLTVAKSRDGECETDLTSLGNGVEM